MSFVRADHVQVGDSLSVRVGAMQVAGEVTAIGKAGRDVELTVVRGRRRWYVTAAPSDRITLTPTRRQANPREQRFSVEYFENTTGDKLSYGGTWTSATAARRAVEFYGPIIRVYRVGPEGRIKPPVWYSRETEGELQRRALAHSRETAAELQQRALARKTNDAAGGMSLAEGRRWRKDMDRRNAEALRAQARATVAALAAAIRAAKGDKRARVKAAAAACARTRDLVRRRAKARAARLRAELREVKRQEIAAARSRCGTAKARAEGDAAIARARGALAAERKHQRDLARIEAGNRASKRTAPRASRAERAAESDDAVAVNLAPELVPLWERVKRSIKGTTRKSRTEAFLAYAEEHPDEVIEAQEDRTDAIVRDLERQQAKARTFARKRRYTAAELADVPF